MQAWHICGVLAAATLLPGCAMEPLAVRSTQGQTLPLSVGQELHLTVGTLGPGEYVAPPSISSPALRFLDANVVPPYLPSGPTQVFRFRAEARGRAVVVITHSGDDPTIQDTVVIR